MFVSKVVVLRSVFAGHCSKSMVFTGAFEGLDLDLDLILDLDLEFHKISLILDERG